MELERQLYLLILKENLLEMMNIVGQIMEYSTLKEDVMQNVLIYQQKKNLKYSMPLNLELSLRMLNSFQKNQELSITMIFQSQRTPE